MNRLPPLLTAITLSIVCSCAAAGPVAADAGNSTASATPTARAAHAGPAGSRGRHAHATCKSSRNHHHKHPHCHAHATHHSNPPTGSEHGRSRTDKASSLASTRTLHARRATRVGGPSNESSVTISLPAASTATSTAASTIADVLATPCQNTELTPEADNLERVETATLCLVNQERARDSELPLQPNAQLAQAAQRHTDDMVSEDYFAHIAPNGETPLDRVQASGYIPNSLVGYTIGENIAWGTLSLATPSSIVAAWIASPEHLANILEGEYRDTAIAVLPAAPASLANGQPGAVYTQEFGVIQG